MEELIIHVLMLKESATQKPTKFQGPHWRRSGSTGLRSLFVNWSREENDITRSALFVSRHRHFCDDGLCHVLQSLSSSPPPTPNVFAIQGQWGEFEEYAVPEGQGGRTQCSLTIS